MERMKKYTGMLVLLILSASLALPDLQMRNLEYSESTGRLVATIYNQAGDAVNGSTVVDFYDNGKFIGQYVYSEPIPRYSIVSVYINYRPSEGNHSFSAIVNPGNTIEEKTASNNQKEILSENRMNTEPQNVMPSQPEAGKEPASQPTVFIIAAILTMLFAVIFMKKARKTAVQPAG